MSLVMHKNIFDFITEKENEYQQPISLNGWDWNMKDHVRTSFFYKHGRLLNGNDQDTPVKNITKPLLNLQYRAEDIDVKDIVLYVDNPSAYHLSFLVKKYHDDVFVVENDLDTFIDKTNESKVDYGLGLVKEMKGVKPEVVDLQSIAFCDQTDILKGPIGFKHYLNPDELKDMESKGWGNPANGADVTIDDLIDLSMDKRDESGDNDRENDTPGMYIEVYEIHGVLPKMFLEDTDSDGYVRQMQIVGFYKSKVDNNRHGVTLFKKQVTKNPFKRIERDAIFSRACGYGGAEELVEPQVWTNYSIIRQKEMLDAASKTVLKAIGTDFKSQYPNGLKDVDNLDIIELNAGEDIGQIDTTPKSMALFDTFEDKMMNQAQLAASAQDPLLGTPAPSGTPFRAQERQVIEGKGIHEYRRGQFAKFLEEVYRDWIIPHIVAKITQGVEFLSELSTEEMQYVVERVVDNQTNGMVKEKILNGEIIRPEEVEAFKARAREDFLKGGNKRFIKILKDEFKGQAVRVKINIAGKQKDLSIMADKITNIFRQIIANPQGFQAVMQMPGMAKSFNDLLEVSGMSPVYFSGITAPTEQAGTPSPLQPTLENNQVNQNA